MIELIFLLSIPFITAFIGWMTNHLAIRMLFRPRQPIRVLGYRWQGLIPKRQKDLARQAAEIIEREVLSQNLLRKELEAVDFEDYIASFTTRVIHDKLGDRLRSIPLLGNFINEMTLSRLAEMAGQEMKKQAPYLKHRLSAEMESRIPIRELVESRISQFELRKLEDLVYLVAGKEFRAIEYLGAVLGFIVGLAQLVILLVTGQLQV
jgi:uncharacterized membrane protein YheB (UPF0754 family)